MKKIFGSIALCVAMVIGSAIGVSAQNFPTNPANGIGWNPEPAIPAGVNTGNDNGGGAQPPAGPPNGIGWNPGPVGNNVSWGSPWGSQWNNPIYSGDPAFAPNVSNQGVTNVIACGYDVQGVWRVLPLTVSYKYNGVQYVVNVLNAWNPWTDTWNTGVDQPAFNTDYFLRGQEYNYYTVLSTGTFYFNLV